MHAPEEKDHSERKGSYHQSFSPKKWFFGAKPTQKSESDLIFPVCQSGLTLSYELLQNYCVVIWKDVTDSTFSRVRIDSHQNSKDFELLLLAERSILTTLSLTKVRIKVAISKGSSAIIFVLDLVDIS